MTILVTGGAGFIGSHVADALLAEGHEVHILDNLSTGRRWKAPEGAPLFEHDIRSEAAASLFAEHQYDCLVHHAAQMDVRKSVEDPSFDADVNVRGLLNLMEAGIGQGLRKVLFASTGGAIYGEPEYTPQDEKHPLRPVSPYGVAKLAAEKYLHYYRAQYEVETVSLRYANVYGPRQNPGGEAGVVAIFTNEMLRGGQPVINGSGEQTRDYVYVGDVVEANLAALKCEGSGTFNVGTGRETSVTELFRALRAETGADLDEAHGPAKPGEQQRSVLGYERAEEKLGWVPRVSVEEGLARTVDWFETRRELEVS
ncbi:NAD-dependent epimerase/dehydratase family protein [Salinibacter ruber]|uniref:NAD-dependent epimerase/dehydratase family protein n=1 Tax=Salinibacter ruber TaxID=146919 RepID=UPI00216A6B43|nr:NAD-dependent epimerase/dehydratase family protein [Salinibacter ruber]MCS3683849.1 UDP-glucose 4-epimerase [Salinibacter ruber]MCS3749320.1 UDP-glucose 4-epimerase [Salinibacter ruber]MCS4055870.1 UDP-glucose 4-epimerase [Salinibacter ruber]MCS4098043.1 UDP-glucose 4-epimerase [Salinibacter ruber]